MTNPSEQDGLNDNGSFDAADAFLNSWKTPKEPSETEKRKKETKAPEETPEPEETDEDLETDESEEDEVDEDSEEDSEEDEGTDDDAPVEKTVAGDDAVVKLTVDGKEIETSVKDLKRLYGQEAALTRKSQEVAAAKKQAEDVTTKAVTSLDRQLQRAREAYKPYQEIDFALAAKELDTETYNALKKEAQERYEDVRFYEQELDGTIQAASEHHKTLMVAEAKETMKALTDPEKGIKGFNEAMYDEMRMYAVNSGVPVKVINEVVSEPILRMLHKAMMYDKGQSVVKKTVKKDLKAKKIVKSTSSPESLKKAVSDGPQKKAMANLRKTGTTEAATDAFLAKWKD